MIWTQEGHVLMEFPLEKYCCCCCCCWLRRFQHLTSEDDFISGCPDSTPGRVPVLCTAEWLSPSNPRLRLGGRLPKSTVILRIPVPRQGGREISARTMCNRSVSNGAVAHFSLAFMTGALRAKRGERDISRGARHEREARDEEKRKISLFSSPRLALRAKYRVRPAWVIKRLSCRLISLRCAILAGTYITEWKHFLIHVVPILKHNEC